jgi:DNA-binding NarL/FixJ family response regulator
MRILLADDHPLFRDGVASLLTAWGHQVVGQAGTGDEAVALADALRPDLVLMDIRMPGLSGLAATAQIKARQPETVVVILTVSEEEDDLFAAIQAGAHGYLLKNVESSQFRTLLEAVARGEAAITPATAARIIQAFRQREEGRRPGGEQLTERELEVLQLVTAGLRNKEIAARLGISENTVKFHLRHILDKLHAQSRAEVAARAVRAGLVPPQEDPVGDP